MPRQPKYPGIEPEGAAPTLAKSGIAFVEALAARANPAAGLPADKAFIDGLYEDNELPKRKATA